jgi:hypothetical protein
MIGNYREVVTPEEDRAGIGGNFRSGRPGAWSKIKDIFPYSFVREVTR